MLELTFQEQSMHVDTLRGILGYVLLVVARYLILQHDRVEGPTFVCSRYLLRREMQMGRHTMSSMSRKLVKVLVSTKKGKKTEEAEERERETIETYSISINRIKEKLLSHFFF